MNIFVARYTDNKGITKSIHFDKAQFDEAKATAYLQSKGIQNFFFFMEPVAPVQFDENTMLFSGEIGYDITFDTLLPYLNSGHNLLVDSFGGSAWEGLKIYDAIKERGLSPRVGVLGSCASAATLILVAVPKAQRWMSENSRFLIHNPWTIEMGDDAQFKRTAAELEATKIQLANIYANETGQNVETMLALMAEERFLTAAETAQYGFINSQINEDDMNNEQVVEKLNVLETMMNKVMAFFKPSPKNIIIQDTNGAEIDFGPEIETEDQIVVGLPATVNGEQANGEYTLSDGRVFVFEAGVLTEIRPVASEEETTVEELTAANEQLAASLADAQNKINALTTERDNALAQFNGVNAQFTALQNEFTSFKSEFKDFKPTPNTPSNGANGDKPKFSFKKK
jgi:ATP-dependent protease ClpP protease subunit